MSIRESIEFEFESLISKQGEVNLYEHCKYCKKNPEHKEFVPISQFTIDNLPEDNRDPQLLDYTRQTAHLTVRVGVEQTSLNRPKGSERKAELSKLENGFTGSGWVESVVKAKWHENEDGSHQFCRCKNCASTTSPSKEWGEVRVHTVRHVVFDDVEASTTTCRLFFDEEDSPLAVIYGLKTCSASNQDERCVLVCVSCDKHLLERLDLAISKWKSLRRDVVQRYRADNSKLAIIVSHPHGCCKHVSVGRWVEKIHGRDGDRILASTAYTYTACTCPGSSGAAVFIMGQASLLLIDHPHCGVTAEGKGYSAYGWDFDQHKMRKRTT